MTEPYHTDNLVTVHHGDCLQHLRDMPDNSVDAIVTDPPYGLSNTTPDKVADTIVRWASGDREHVPEGRGFMGRPWDAFVPPPAVWDECLRVLKPGGHMAVFAGSRTQDLMGMSIRLAGFELRDSLAWIYGSGFPKSMDVSKAIDKKRDDNNDWKTVGSFLKSHRVSAGYATRNSFADKILNGHSNLASAAANLSNWENGLSFPTWERWEQLKGLLGLPDDMDAEVWRLNGRKGTPGEAWEKREVVGVRTTGIGTGKGGTAFIGDSDNKDITTSHSDAAKRWEGFGTALKPAIEPILLCRKPLDGTVAANVLAHGVGGLNIDACRVQTDDDTSRPPGRDGGNATWDLSNRDKPSVSHSAGRWPANVLLDEHAATEMDKQSGPAGSNSTSPGSRGVGMFGNRTGGATHDTRDSGGASRFFPVFKSEQEPPAAKGRFPANVLLDEHAAQEMDRQSGVSVSTKRLGKYSPTTPTGNGVTHGKMKGIQTDRGVEDSGGASRFFPVFKSEEGTPETKGRFPANVLLDEHAAKEMDQQSGVSVSVRASRTNGKTGTAAYGDYGAVPGNDDGYDDSGGASRFFPVFKYQAKAPKRERPVIEREDGTKVQHPTVKPLALMSWLVTLITPPGGVVLDPFAGSGTTLEAARDKGFRAVGVEADADHCELIVARLAKDDGGLFAA